MSEPIKYLTDTHHKMAIALSLMDGEINNFRSGETLDYFLISSILDYMTRSTQLDHHEVEDEIYRQICLAAPDVAASIADIRVDHEKLVFLCDALKEALRNVEMDNELPRMWLVSVAREYLTAQRRHMQTEENSLFPAALEVLGKADWDRISAQMAQSRESDRARAERTEIDDLGTDILGWKTDHICPS